MKGKILCNRGYIWRFILLPIIALVMVSSTFMPQVSPASAQGTNLDKPISVSKAERDQISDASIAFATYNDNLDAVGLADSVPLALPQSTPAVPTSTHIEATVNTSVPEEEGNDTLGTATALPFPEDPPGSGYSMGQSLSSIQPATDKIAPSGYGGENYIREEDNLLAYMIRFENTGEATSPARMISITDTLDEDLYLGTFQLTEIAFANQIIAVPPGLDHYETSLALVIDNEFVSGAEIRCEIAAWLDTDTRELTLVMMGLDPETGDLPEDPLLGILYPNDETGRGCGYMSYVVEHIDGLPTGTEITNKARIVLDWNDPMDTPLVINTIDADPPSSHVNPLPATQPQTFTVTWQGDDGSGSGIASYDICVSDNSGPFNPWLSDTTQLSSEFTGTIGHTYSFYSIATDNVGYVEEAPPAADASTTVVSEGITLNLKAGWNMVSVPVAPIDNSTSVVFPGVAGIFTWDTTSRSYYVPAVIEPEKGYWVAVTEDTAVTIDGPPVETWTTDIKAGWNMIGSVNSTISIADPNDDPDGSVIPTAYWWDPMQRKYIETTDIEPGKGYWVASINDCTLTL
jgi:hypothetical protein